MTAEEKKAVEEKKSNPVTHTLESAIAGLGIKKSDVLNHTIKADRVQIITTGGRKLVFPEVDDNDGQDYHNIEMKKRNALMHGSIIQQVADAAAKKAVAAYLEAQKKTVV